jgi:hypothetical protein
MKIENFPAPLLFFILEKPHCLVQLEHTNYNYQTKIYLPIHITSLSLSHIYNGPPKFTLSDNPLFSVFVV